MSTALALAACVYTSTIPIVGGASVARRSEEGIAWDARLIVDVDASFDFKGGRIAFATPLPADESLRSAPWVNAIVASVDGAERITGLCIAPEALNGRTIRASFIQTTPLNAGRSTFLGAPIVAGPAVQIVDAPVGDELRLEAVRGGGLEPHVGFLAAHGIGHDAREDARRLTDLPLPVGHTSIYVRGDDLKSAGPLEGSLVGTRAKARSSIAGAALAFLGVVAALIAGARALRKAATAERADAILAAEIDAAASDRP